MQMDDGLAFASGKGILNIQRNTEPQRIDWVISVVQV
jgi:hypothetical protein